MNNLFTLEERFLKSNAIIYLNVFSDLRRMENDRSKFFDSHKMAMSIVPRISLLQKILEFPKISYKLLTYPIVFIDFY